MIASHHPAKLSSGILFEVNCSLIKVGATYAAKDNEGGNFFTVLGGRHGNGLPDMTKAPLGALVADDERARRAP
jgi:hypothetical protein